MSNELGFSRRMALKVPQIRRLYDELTKAWARIEELENAGFVPSNAEQSADSQHSEALLLVAQAQAREQGSKLYDAAQKIAALRADIAALEQQVEQLNHEKVELQKQSEELNKNAYLQHTQYQDQLQKTQELEAQQTELTATHEHVSAQYAALQARLVEFDAGQAASGELDPKYDNPTDLLARSNQGLAELAMDYKAQLPSAADFLHEAREFKQLLQENRELMLGRLGEVDRQLDAGLSGLGAIQQDTMRSLSLRMASMPERSDGASETLADPRLWLDIVEASLTGTLYDDAAISPWSEDSSYDSTNRLVGHDWPQTAVTMIGSARMRNLRSLCEQVLLNGVSGDFLEAGVWRGGACIYMRLIQHAYAQAGRKVYVADSFAGLPEPDAEKYPADKGDTHSEFEQLAVSLDQVKENFRRYGVLEDNVVFLPGWFKDTLTSPEIGELALLRLDGDMYGSTIETLEALYHKVSSGGVVIVDDYVLEPCAQAVNDFRRERGIDAEIHAVDKAAIWWQV